MTKKIFLLATVFFAAMQIGFTQDSLLSGTLSLKQCIDIALKNNIDINRSEFDMQDSKVTAYTIKSKQAAVYEWKY
jgi:hypothetical protein